MDEDLTVPEQRPRTVLYCAVGTLCVFNPTDEVVELIDESPPDDLLRFDSYKVIGDPTRPGGALEPHTVWVRRDTIATVAEMTKRMWEDSQRNVAHQQLGVPPGMVISPG